MGQFYPAPYVPPVRAIAFSFAATPAAGTKTPPYRFPSPGRTVVGFSVTCAASDGVNPTAIQLLQNGAVVATVNLAAGVLTGRVALHIATNTTDVWKPNAQTIPAGTSDVECNLEYL